MRQKAAFRRLLMERRENLYLSATLLLESFILCKEKRPMRMIINIKKRYIPTTITAQGDTQMKVSPTAPRTRMMEVMMQGIQQIASPTRSTSKYLILFFNKSYLLYSKQKMARIKVFCNWSFTLMAMLLERFSRYLVKWELH